MHHKKIVNICSQPKHCYVMIVAQYNEHNSCGIFGARRDHHSIPQWWKHENRQSTVMPSSVYI